MNLSKLVALVLFLAVPFSCSAAEKKEMKASKIISLAKKGKPVHVVNKIIIGDLDFSQAGKPVVLNASVLQCNIESGIFFESCVFLGKVTSNGVHGKASVQTCFRSNIIFTGCDFRGEVDFSGAVVFGMVNFSRSVFREAANFNHIAVWAKHSFFSETNAEKGFTMVDASFAGNLTVFGSTFHQNASFQEMSTKGKLVFNNSVFKGRAGFDMMTVFGDTFFNYARFERIADFSSSRFIGMVDFVNANFDRPKNTENAFFMHSVKYE